MEAVFFAVPLVSSSLSDEGEVVVMTIINKQYFLCQDGPCKTENERVREIGNKERKEPKRCGPAQELPRQKLKIQHNT